MPNADVQANNIGFMSPIAPPMGMSTGIGPMGSGPQRNVPKSEWGLDKINSIEVRHYNTSSNKMPLLVDRPLHSLHPWVHLQSNNRK